MLDKNNQRQRIKGMRKIENTIRMCLKVQIVKKKEDRAKAVFEEYLLI